MTVSDQTWTDGDPDSALMMEVGKGSHDAFISLIHTYQCQLVNFFRRMGAYHDAEDLTQETFVRLYKARERYRPTAKFKTFVYVIARHVLADHGRKWFQRERLRLKLLQEPMSVDESGLAQSRHMDVEAALASLSDKLRSVVVLSIYQGMRYEDIAEVLEIPEGTVKSRMNLAIKALREYLHEKA
jgi:RNA polymerase sigma-70 factor (ECF subfamily)